MPRRRREDEAKHKTTKGLKPKKPKRPTDALRPFRRRDED